MAEILIQTFGLGQPVTEESPEVLGGKGAGLVWMDKNEVNVPPGFILPTTLWADYKKAPKGTMKAIAKAIKPYLEQLQKKFGYMPLLSVRSGARVSCPGMMDTILNVGIDSSTEAIWREKLGDSCYADSLKRLVVMYGNVVMGIDREELEKDDLLSTFESYTRKTKQEFPSFQDQLLGSIEAVFKSWDNGRAVYYRKMNNIPAEWGTACVVQAMVFGNMNDDSGTGVLFTRNPDNGENKILGEFLVNAQGEDVVAGIKTPMKLNQMEDWNDDILGELVATVKTLETLKKDVQDVEFTIQDGELFILQTRNAKRSATAKLKIALDMVQEGLITGEEALSRVTMKDMDIAAAPVIDPSFDGMPIGKGIPACSGVVSGVMVFTAEAAVKSKVPCILVTKETTPDDIAGMHSAVGVLTMHGGATSHAAVVARGMNKPCVVGLGMNLTQFKEAESKEISIDGATGRVWFGKVPTKSCPPALMEGVKSMAQKALGYVPIVESAPAINCTEVYVCLGARVLDPQGCVEFLAGFKKTCQHVYVDIGTYTPQEETYIKQMGDFEPSELIKELEDHIEFIPKITLVGGFSENFPSISTGKSLEDIVMATEGLMVSLADPSPAIQKVLGWKKAEGVPLISLGVVSKDAAKSFASFEQVLSGDAL